MAQDVPVEEFIVQRIARVLDVDPASLDRSASYKKLGLDSMSLIGLTGEVEQLTGVALSPELLADNDSIEKIAQYIESKKSEKA